MKIRKMIATVAAMAFMLSAAMPAQAANEVATTGDVTATGQQACTVTITKASSGFTVTIPKTITMDGTTNTMEYTVTVKGDLTASDVVSVTPDATFSFKQAEKADVTASIAQTKTEWQLGADGVTEAGLKTGVSTTGTITVGDLSAGTWVGTFNFNIEHE